MVTRRAGVTKEELEGRWRECGPYGGWQVVARWGYAPGGPGGPGGRLAVPVRPSASGAQAWRGWPRGLWVVGWWPPDRAAGLTLRARFCREAPEALGEVAGALGVGRELGEAALAGSPTDPGCVRHSAWGTRGAGFAPRGDRDLLLRAASLRLWR